MMKGLNNIEKICGFYVSDWHLAVMLLPYINQEAKNNKSIITFLQQNLEDNMLNLLEKLNLQENDKSKIREIKWTNQGLLNYSTIEKSLSIIKGEKTILVSGKSEYIEAVNASIERYSKNNKKQKIKIINCYEVSGFNKNMKEVLDKHDKVLNTAGEKNIEEVFEGYEKKISNE